MGERSSISHGTLDPKWLAAPVTILALALSSALGQTDTPLPIADSPATSETSTAASEQDLPPMQIPTIGMSRPLSVAEIRWCVSREIGLQAMQPILGTQSAIDYYNELAVEFNDHCGARHYRESDSKEAARLVDETRGETVAAAIDDIQQVNDRALTTRIQEMLEHLGYELEIDGVYGARMKEVIQNFQLKVGIPADGLMSPSLLGRLQIEHMRYATGRENARSPGR